MDTDAAGNRYGISIGDIIAVQHYSGINPFKSIVLKVTDDLLTVKLTKDFAVMSFLEGDPVIFGYEKDDSVCVFGCGLQSINSSEGIVELSIDKFEEGAQKRQYERFPVSLYADVRAVDGKKKYLATIKDISYYGMKVFSKADYTPNQQLDVDIYMDKSIVFLKANVIRRQEKENHIEYGLGILYEDTNSLSFMKDYIRRLKQEQEDTIRKLKQIK